MTIYSEIFGGPWPPRPLGYAYGRSRPTAVGFELPG